MKIINVLYARIKDTNDIGCLSKPHRKQNYTKSPVVFDES